MIKHTHDLSTAFNHIRQSLCIYNSFALSKMRPYLSFPPPILSNSPYKSTSQVVLNSFCMKSILLCNQMQHSQTKNSKWKFTCIARIDQNSIKQTHSQIIEHKFPTSKQKERKPNLDNLNSFSKINEKSTGRSYQT